MHQMLTTAILATCFAASSWGVAQGQDADSASQFDESANYTVTKVLENLNKPSGLALRPGIGKPGPEELFIAESGAGRVVWITTDQPGGLAEAVTGLSPGFLGDNSELQLGPAGLAFIARNLLVVGGGALPDNAGVLSVYLLAADGSAVTAEQINHTVGPVRASDSAANGAGVFLGMTNTELSLFSTWSDENKGWILKSGIEANRLAYLQPLATPKQTGSLGAPTGIAVIPSPRPPFLVVAHMGSFQKPQDSTLSFYVPSSAKLAMTIDTGLNDILGLAYSPTGQLYAADFSREVDAAGGVYRLDDAYKDGQQTCQAVRIASVSRPTALTFTADGELYVTAHGGDGKTQGVLLKITGDL
ncbi:MAG: hypothetical protein KDA57_19995 [Planctomycetales bacterium]|nr:hypothetical protein [Planctomycetales bacterium]